ncbi:MULTISPECIES: hypothetical protein [Priestia]|uniref:hypothetical protein n=1 Tax=Priestia TaxID=2800373 RepID=UPI00203FE90A|nr:MULTISPECIES: hypothetical protein [Priestia]MCM3772841.1 hypothetical protein [Priestia aryabhattai]MDY0941579.1 hypothetical protein [Priestia megaterium]
MRNGEVPLQKTLLTFKVIGERMVLNKTSKDTLNIENIYINNVAKEIQKYFQQEAKDDVSVRNKVYCTYLTHFQNDTFILKEDGTYVKVNPKDNSDTLKEVETH